MDCIIRFVFLDTHSIKEVKEVMDGWMGDGLTDGGRDRWMARERRDYDAWD